MNASEFFSALMSATGIEAVAQAISNFEQAQAGRIQWKPFGRENNRGTVEASTDPGRSLVERITNGIDAILELENARHAGRPVCRSPKEAASAWLNVPDGGLSEMSPTQRRQLAQRVSIHLQAGEGRESRVITVRDRGIGLTAAQMPSTILSLNETNKSRKLYLAGAYGQGGSSTLAVSKYTLIASRADSNGPVAFTVASFFEPPPDEDKVGRYVYVTLDNQIIEVNVSEADFPTGTVAKHFGYDLSEYNSPLGVTSTYGLLNRILFDPVMPVWLDNPVNSQRRVIKGSRNALNGAVDEGDDNNQTIVHSVPQYFTSIGHDHGRIGIEYWVLPRPTRENKSPSRAYVNPAKPVILTINGQNQAELPASIIRKDADLPFLTQRLIVHVDCNQLSPGAKRLLFVSNREEARKGAIRKLITDEVKQALISDDELRRLNDQARDQDLNQQDEQAQEDMRREVSRLLRMQGLNVERPVGASEGDTEQGRPVTPRPPRPHVPPVPIQLREPPTYIRWMIDSATPISFYAEQRRYLRIETDAASTYHNPRNPAASRINVIVTGTGINNIGSTPLKGGRLRAIVEGLQGAQVGTEGTIRVELSRTGLPTLSDERTYRVVAPPQITPANRPLGVPEWKVKRVEGPEDPLWLDLGWPDDINQIASTAQMENGVLNVYYSARFPRFQVQETLFERRDTALAQSFRHRYQIWLAVHSLLMHEDQQRQPAREGEQAEADDELREQYDRKERMRIATLSALFAAREVEIPVGAVLTADAE